MIRRIINRVRRQEPSQTVVFTPQAAPEVEGRPAVHCGRSGRRGATRPPLGMIRAQRRSANKVARAARKRNRV